MEPLDAGASPNALAELMATDDSGVLTLVGPPGACQAWARRAVELAVDLTGRLADEVRFQSPAKDRWTVAELTELVVAPVTTRPVGPGWVIVVADAASMDALASARLLKTLEEPPSPAWYVLCRDVGEELPAALRGRVTADIALDGDGDPLSDAADAAGAGDRLAELRVLPRPGRNPVATATRWGRDVRDLAGTLRPRPVGPWTRRIARAALADAAARTTAALAAGADPIACDRAAREIVAARSRLDRYVPVESAIAPVIDSLGRLGRRAR